MIDDDDDASGLNNYEKIRVNERRMNVIDGLVMMVLIIIDNHDNG